jgi:hypothetical protein
MVRVLKPLGNLITTRLVGPEFPGMNAGPSFELFYENDYLMPHRDAAWVLLEERIREAAKFCGLVREIAPQSVADELRPVEEALSDVADSLAARFAEWGRRSRFAASAAQQQAAPDGNAGKSLARRVASLAHAVSAAEVSGTHGKRLTSLFGSAHSALGHDGDGATAVRVVESVLRPLAEAITGKRLRARTKMTAAGGGAGGAELHGQLWTLAQNATKELARWRGDRGQETLLIEATAALQDLALRSSSPDDRDARLATLRKLQADRPRGIRCAHNAAQADQRLPANQPADARHPSGQCGPASSSPSWKPLPRPDLSMPHKRSRSQPCDPVQTRISPWVSGNPEASSWMRSSHALDCSLDCFVSRRVVRAILQRCEDRTGTASKRP